MQDFPLTIAAILRHGEQGVRRQRVRHVDRRRARAARPSRRSPPTRTGSRHVLARLGVRRRRSRRHVLLEHAGAPRGVPRGPVDGRGAAHAEHPAVPRAARLRRSTTREDKVIIVDDSLVPVLAKVAARARDRRALHRGRRRRRVGAARRPTRRDRCATTSSSRREPRRVRRGPRSTNGRPRRCVTRRARPATRRASRTRTGRRTCTRSSATTPTALGLSERDRILTIVPMFHANAWGIPYAAFMCGASLVMPGRFLQAEPLTRMVKEERVTFSGAVPTIWADILRYGEEHEIDLSSLRMIICGGSAVPRSLMETLRGALRRAHRAGLGDDRDVAARRGRAPAGVGRARQRRGDGLARDDRPRRRRRRAAHRRRRGQPAAVGRRSGRRDRGARPVDHRPYYFGDPSPEKFDDGWLRTGDVGSVNAHGLRADHRPGQGRDQVGRRVDQLGRAREPPDGAPRRGRGERDRRARPALGRAAARVRRAQGRRRRRRGRARRRSSASGSRSGRCPSAGASSTRCRRRQRRQVRQEGAAGPAREGRARRSRRSADDRRRARARSPDCGAMPSRRAPTRRPRRRSCWCATATTGSRCCSRGGRRSSRSTAARGCSPAVASIPTTTRDAPDDLVRARPAAPRRARRRKRPASTSTPTRSSTSRTGRRPRSRPSGSRRGSSSAEVAGGDAVADGAETDELQWFRPDEALAARATRARSSSRRRST